MKRLNRARWLGAIALGAIVLLTLVAAPSTSHLNSGSTYSRAPDGYGAWYAFMQQRGTPVKRWQKPFSSLLQQEASTTLLRVNSRSEPPLIEEKERDWLKKGNTLVVLGVQEQVTEGAFSTLERSPIGNIKIDTRRRYLNDKEQLLGDRFGAVVWEQKIGKGRLIFSVTPHLAANAYQEYLSNYAYLAKLVRPIGNQSGNVWVDEYSHGYKDSDVTSDSSRNWISYLAQKPILPVLLQGSILLLVLIRSENRRFGPPQPLETPVVDNSSAYIQALAGVLHKAESSDFVLETVGKAEQQKLRQVLGLGQVQDHQLFDAWVQKTGLPAAELLQLLQVQSKKRRISESELLAWLRKWRIVRRHL